jgi:hypothetical protein
MTLTGYGSLSHTEKDTIIHLFFASFQVLRQKVDDLRAESEALKNKIDGLRQ